MVGLVVELRRRSYGAEDRSVGLRVYLFSDHETRQREVGDFWLEATRLPRTRCDGRS
jgi:hypothetical protein